MKELSNEIIAKEIRKFWIKHGYPCEVIVLFEQKYTWEKNWEKCAEFASPFSDSDEETVLFQNDFNEGQTDVRNIRIISFEEAAEILERFLTNPAE